MVERVNGRVHFCVFLNFLVIINHMNIAYYWFTRDTGKILMSSGGAKRGAAFGDGVYLTSLSPENRTKMELAKNNYDGLAVKQEEAGRIDYWFEFNLPVEVVSECSTVRDVWLYPGRNLHFRKAIKSINFYLRKGELGQRIFRILLFEFLGICIFLLREEKKFLWLFLSVTTAQPEMETSQSSGNY